MSLSEFKFGSENQFNIQRLKADNHFIWARKMKLILLAKGVWPIVSGEEIRPIVKGDNMQDLAEYEKLVLQFQQKKYRIDHYYAFY